MIIEQIKKDRIQAMKEKQKAKATALATLLGEIDTEVKRGNVLDDALVIAKIQKTIKGLDEILKLEPKATAVLNEKAILSEYLPKMMTEVEIESALIDYRLAYPSAKLGDVMKYFKSAFNGSYEPSMVKRIWEDNCK